MEAVPQAVPATNHSDVAALRRLIEQEHQLMWQAYYGLSSGTAKHTFITARMERIGTHQQDLAALVGEGTSMEIVCEIVNMVVSS